MVFHQLNGGPKNRSTLQISPEIHAMLKAFAAKKRMSIAFAADLLIPRAIAHVEGLPVPPLEKQIATMIGETKSSPE